MTLIELLEFACSEVVEGKPRWVIANFLIDSMGVHYEVADAIVRSITDDGVMRRVKT